MPASSWPASSWTARSWPTWPSATPNLPTLCRARPRGVGGPPERTPTNIRTGRPSSTAPFFIAQNVITSRTTKAQGSPQAASARATRGPSWPRARTCSPRPTAPAGKPLLRAARGRRRRAESCSTASRRWDRAPARSRVYEQRWGTCRRAAVRLSVGRRETRATWGRPALALAFGAASVVLGPDCADRSRPKAVRQPFDGRDLLGARFSTFGHFREGVRDLLPTENYVPTLDTMRVGLL